MKFKLITAFAVLFIIFSNAVFAQQGMGVGTNNPQEMLDVTGAIKIGTDINNTNAAPTGGAGTIRFRAGQFEGWDGGSWIPLGGGGGNSPFLVDNNLVQPNNTIVDLATDDFIFGSPSLDDDADTDHDGRFFYDKSKGAFRAGLVRGDQWDNVKRGNQSFAVGYDVTASGDYSMTLGERSWAIATGAIAMGRQAYAEGEMSFAWGNDVQATGEGSVALGRLAFSTADYSYAVGTNVNADSEYSMAVGADANATASYAIALGNNANATAASAFVLGHNSTASSYEAAAFGYDVNALGEQSIGFGHDLTALSNYEIVLGRYNSIYAPSSATSWVPTDRLFSIGNGENSASRSNAFTILKNGNTGIGTTTPSATLHVDGSLRYVDGNQAAGYIPVSDANGTMTWTDPATISTSNDNDWTVNGNNQYSAVSGNVGFGVNNPASKIHVSSTTNDATGGMRLTSPSGSSVIYMDGSDLVLRKLNQPDQLVLDYSGRVGVGTNSPSAEFQVMGSIRMVDGNEQIGFIPVATTNGTMVWTDPNTITTAADGDGDSGNEIQSLSLTGNTLAISGSNNVDLSGYVSTDDQSLTGAALTGTTLQIDIEGGSSTSVDLSSLVDDADADSNNEFQDLSSSTSGTNRTINISNGTGTTISVADNDNNSSNELQTLSQSGNDVTLSNGGGTISVADNDNNSSNELQTLSISGNDITLSNSGGTVTVPNDGDWTVSGNDQYSAVSGNVGVGTATPLEKLEVLNGDILVSTNVNSTSREITIYGARTGGGTTFNSGAGFGILNFDNYDNNGSASRYTGARIESQNFGTGPNDGDLRFYTANNEVLTEAMRISAIGNVGIGAFPAEQLHVAGNIRMVDGNQAAGYIPVSDANGTMVWTDPTTVSTSDDGDWTINGNNQYSAVSGNIGIGDPSPDTKLHISSSSTGDATGIKLTQGTANSLIYHNSSNDLIIRKQGQSDQLVLDNGGNIGVGTAAPGDELHVEGSIRMADGNQGAGKVAVSDANGTMSWTDRSNYIAYHKQAGVLSFTGSSNSYNNIAGLTSTTLNVQSGDIITLRAEAIVNFTSGSGSDDFYMRVTYGNCSTGNSEEKVIRFDEDGGHDNPTTLSYLDVITAPCTGTLWFRFQIKHSGDDPWEAVDGVIVVTKY